VATETDVIEVRFKATADGAVVAAYDKIAAASTKTEATIKRFDAANDNAFRRMNEGVSKGARAIGAFSMAASQAEPALGKLGSTAMRTAETVMSFGTYLGGPWGIALGLAVGAVGLLTAEFASQEERVKKTREEYERYLKLYTEQEAKEKALRPGVVTDTTSSLVDLRSKAGKDALFEHYQSGGSAVKGNKLVDPSAEGGSGKGPGAGPEFEAMQRRSENEQRMRDLDRTDAESRARVASADAMMQGRGFEDPSKAGDATRAKLDREFDLQREHNERMKSEADEINEHYAKLDAEAAQRTQFGRQVASDAFKATASVGLDAFRKLAQGHKMSAKEALAAIGDTLAASGQGHMLQAGAYAFIPGMQGNAGGLFAAGALEFAFGVGLGAAASGGRGGGGGGSRAPHARSGESGGDYLDRTRAASPTTSRGGSVGGGGTTVVNVSMPTVVSPNADDGARVKAALREAERAGV
jgi:hypothetical protein